MNPHTKKNYTTRRRFLEHSCFTGALGALALTNTGNAIPADSAADKETASAKTPLRLGLMTYNLAKDWDLDTVIRNCQQAKFEHAELRTTHAHGVEVNLSKAQRHEVRKRFEDAGIRLSLASAFAYHWPDQAKLREHIEGTKEYTLLAQDIGALGIRVFPNSINVDGVPAEQTMEQIGKAAAEVGEFAADHGVEIRLANHGKGTNRVSVLRKILDHANSPHVYVNWNCDKTDIEAPGFETHFNMVKDQIRNIHLHDLSDGIYPYRKLFALLRANNYRRYCDAEVPASLEPLRFMKYYRALFLALQNVV